MIFIFNEIVDPSIAKIARKYEIKKTMADRLEKLRNFEIVIVIDDSGSMITAVDRTQRTRWDELRDIVKIVIEIGVIFDANGIDIYFINGRNFLKVKDPRVVDEAFATPPSGYTPLVPVLEKIFQSPLSNVGRDKKLLVFVATDGEPTDDDGNPVVSELAHVMQNKRQTDTTYVSFLLCTDVQACVEYLSKWDKAMQNIDVTDDFYTETAKIRQYRGRNFPFTFGDYIVKALIGAIDREIDILNEPN